eukprot:366268-Chlamydomonas_euryale.AAC.12
MAVGRGLRTRAWEQEAPLSLRLLAGGAAPPERMGRPSVASIAFMQTGMRAGLPLCSGDSGWRVVSRARARKHRPRRIALCAACAAAPCCWLGAARASTNTGPAGRCPARLRLPRHLCSGAAAPPPCAHAGQRARRAPCAASRVTSPPSSPPPLPCPQAS